MGLGKPNEVQYLWYNNNPNVGKLLLHFSIAFAQLTAQLSNFSTLAVYVLVLLEQNDLLALELLFEYMYAI